MKVYINGRFLIQALTGVQRYAIEMVRALDNLIATDKEIRNKFEFILLVPRNCRNQIRLNNISYRTVGRFAGHLWEQLELPFYCRTGILINLCNVAPIFKKRQTVTIHDVAVFAFPEAYSFSFRTWYKFLSRSLVKNDAQLVTDSMFSHSEIRKYLNAREENLTVIVAGIEHISRVKSDRSILGKLGLESRQFLLAVASLNERKNFRSLLAALGEVRLKGFQTVVVGGANEKVFGSWNLKLPENVIHISQIRDEELKALYENAAAFVYPSLYEGFGLPPLEAMACGAAVVVSDIPPHHEVCGEAAIYCDPLKKEDIAEKIEKVLDYSDLRKKLAQKGKERAMIFSWQKSARALVNLISNKFVDENRHRP